MLSFKNGAEANSLLECRMENSVVKEKKGLNRYRKQIVFLMDLFIVNFVYFVMIYWGADSQRHIDHRDIHMDTEPDADDCLPVRFFVGV